MNISSRLMYWIYRNNLPMPEIIPDRFGYNIVIQQLKALSPWVS